MPNSWQTDVMWRGDKHFQEAAGVKQLIQNTCTSLILYCWAQRPAFSVFNIIVSIESQHRLIRYCSTLLHLMCCGWQVLCVVLCEITSQRFQFWSGCLTGTIWSNWCQVMVLTISEWNYKSCCVVEAFVPSLWRNWFSYQQRFYFPLLWLDRKACEGRATCLLILVTSLNNQGKCPIPHNCCLVNECLVWAYVFIRESTISSYFCTIWPK